MILITLLCAVLASSKPVDGPDSGKSDLIYPNVLTDMDCRGRGWESVNYGFNGTREGSEGKFLDMKCYIHVDTDDKHVCERKWTQDDRTYYGCDTRIPKYKGAHWCYTESGSPKWDYCHSKDELFCVGSDNKESEGGRFDHRMQCGYSYLPVNEIEDNALVLSDVKMIVCNSDNEGPGANAKRACECPSEGKWEAKMHFDSYTNKDAEGAKGKYAVLCAKRETYGDMQKQGKELVTGLGVLLKNDIAGSRTEIGSHRSRYGNRKYYHNNMQGRETRDHDVIRFYVQKEVVKGAKKALFAKTFGIWKIAQTGNGKGSRSISREMEVSEGFSKSEEMSDSFGTTISHEASISLTAGYTPPGTGGGHFSATVGYSFNHQTSRESTLAVGRIAEESMSNTEGESCSVDVPDSFGETGEEWVMWVFEIVREGTGGNEGKQASQKMCNAYFKTGKCKNSPPRCVPGYCKDKTECNSCTREDMEMNENYEACESDFNLFEHFNLDSIHGWFDTVFGLFPQGGMSWLSFALLLLLITAISISVCCCCCRNRARKVVDEQPCCC